MIGGTECFNKGTPDNKVHGANMGPTWALSAPDGPHVGLMNLAIRNCFLECIWLDMHYCCGPELSLRWRHNGRDSVWNHQPHDCLLNRLFSRRSKKTSKLRVTGLCAGNSPGTGEFPAQMASNAKMFPLRDDVIWLCKYGEGLFLPVFWTNTNRFGQISFTFYLLMA